MPIEVKNVRDWIYPANGEPYQLLSKAHRLARLVPGQPIVPVLICRQAHPTIFRMASDLGFFVIAVKRQYIGPSADEDKLAALRSELGFYDLAPERASDALLVRRFTTVLPPIAAAAAERWDATAAVPALGDLFEAMRTATWTIDRTRFKDLIRETADANGLVTRGGW